MLPPGRSHATPSRPRRHRRIKPRPPRPRSLLPPDEAVSPSVVFLPKIQIPSKNPPPNRPSTQIWLAVLLCRAARPSRQPAKLRRASPRSPYCSPNMRLVRPLLRHADLGPHARPLGLLPASRCCTMPGACCYSPWLAQMGFYDVKLEPFLGPSLCPAA